MNRQSSSICPVIVAAILALFLPLAAYVVSYHLLSEYAGDYRLYHHQWQVTIFRPAVYVERAVTGQRLGIGYRWREAGELHETVFYD